MEKINKSEIHDLFYNISTGNKACFDILYEKYSRLVYNIAFSILKNRENSKDVVQSVYEKIWNLNKEKLLTKNDKKII